MPFYSINRNSHWIHEIQINPSSAGTSPCGLSQYNDCIFILRHFKFRACVLPFHTISKHILWHGDWMRIMLRCMSCCVMNTLLHGKLLALMVLARICVLSNLALETKFCIISIRGSSPAAKIDSLIKQSLFSFLLWCFACRNHIYHLV